MKPGPERSLPRTRIATEKLKPFIQHRHRVQEVYRIENQTRGHLASFPVSRAGLGMRLVEPFPNRREPG